MKKVLILAAFAAVGFVAPAHAGNYCDSSGHCTGPSANDMRRYESRGYDSYHNGGYYGGSLLGAVIAQAIIGGGSHKPKNGELRTLPDGTSVSYDKASNRWVAVNKPATQPRGVYVDRDVYAAN